MTTRDDDQSGPGAPPAAPVRDRRPTPAGVLPRSLQMWLMVGIAGVIFAIILITGRPQAPTPSTGTSAAPSSPMLAPTDRIRSYAQRLAEEEARQREAAGRGTATPPSSSGAGEPFSPGAPTAGATGTRSTRGLLADNVALSHRPTGQQPYAASASTRDSLAATAAPASSATSLDQLEQTLLRALTQGPPQAVRRDQPLPPGPTTSRSPTAPQATVSTGPSTSTDTRAETPASGPRFRLFEGTVIEAVLVNRLDGTFAGPVVGLVTTPVYAPDRQQVLIPAGARVFGAATPVQGWGDSRLAVSFHRLLMPDGHSYSLDLFKGLNAVGETGLRDSVDHHYLQVFGASLAIGAISGLAQYSTRSSVGVLDVGDAFQQSAGASLATSTSRILDRYLNVLPTIRVREGTRMKVYLTNDVELPAYGAVAPGGRP
mgnify:CR=1 FL=1